MDAQNERESRTKSLSRHEAQAFSLNRLVHSGRGVFVVNDQHVFSHENILKQLETAELRLGYFVLRFYVDQNEKPAGRPTERISDFYLFPSGGTLRDSQMNLLFYDSRYDTYRGFKPPRRHIP